MELLIKPEKAKENSADNHTYKILRLLDILSDFLSPQVKGSMITNY